MQVMCEYSYPPPGHILKSYASIYKPPFGSLEALLPVIEILALVNISLILFESYAYIHLP
jgi:hypothetical protein